MKNHNHCSSLQLFLTAVFTLSIATSANAALVSRLNGQAVYDTDLNITWLADANLAASNTFGVAGIDNLATMTWPTTQDWIAAMNATNYLGFNDWRLPTTLQPDASCSVGSEAYGFNCTGSEMGHLFYQELGGVANTDINSVHNGNYNLFSNISTYGYWSGTDFSGVPQSAWEFGFLGGYQNAYDKGSNRFAAWAVRTGDVAVVPIPAAFWLFGSGLIGLFGSMRRRK